MKAESIIPQSSSPMLKFELSLPKIPSQADALVQILLDSVSLTSEAILIAVCEPALPAPTIS